MAGGENKAPAAGRYKTSSGSVRGCHLHLALRVAVVRERCDGGPQVSISFDQ